MSALDLNNNGQLTWHIQTGDLLSSTIHRLEITSQGKNVRMIPSLNGGIYKFDGDSIEAIPVTADDLIKSSFKFKDDMLISGGHEKRTYGVNMRTGKIIYEHSIDRNNNHDDRLHENPSSSQNENSSIDDVLVVTRHKQTVRASEPLTGNEKWNFTIGHAELQIALSENCHQKKDKNNEELNKLIENIDIRVIIPEGLICGYSKDDPTNPLWIHKFDSPIVSVFRSNKENVLHSVDLFKNTHWLWQDHGNDHFIKTKGTAHLSPSLYLGMYHQQFYIQESTSNQKRLEMTNDDNIQKIPFKPIPAANNALIEFVMKFDTNNMNKNENVKERRDLMIIDSQTVLNAYPNAEGRGFYFYSDQEPNNQSSCLNNDINAKKAGKSTTNNPQSVDNITFQSHQQLPVRLSLWFYWKEITVIALTTAFIINFMLRNKDKVVYVPMAKDAMEYQEEEIAKKKQIEMIRNEAQLKLRSLSESSHEQQYTYVSRFLTDFELIQCLGKGGFGVVFQVVNKLDEINYAVKRILLPSKKESRERVLREVKTLANCEHKNIVRYFHAWVEQPPRNWQEQKDKEILSRDIFSTSITIESPSPTDDSKVFSALITNQSYSKVQQQNLMTSSSPDWLLNLNNKEFSSFSRAKCDYDKDDDSFIQFKAETNSADESFEIEFKKSSSDNSKSEATKISIEESGKNVKKHRRNLSLELTNTSYASNLFPKKVNSANSRETNHVRMYLYIQMQLCMKTSLKDWLKERDLSMRESETVEIWNQIIQAVHYVHLKGLIHRDLKPSNIFFALDGSIKIGDFGLVTDMSDIPIDPIASSSSNSSANFDFDYTIIGKNKKHTQRVGTSLYMSPEQAKGQPYNYKVDIYSLGLIFFELLNFFTTESERYKVLQNIKNHQFPKEFCNRHKEEVSKN